MEIKIVQKDHRIEKNPMTIIVISIIPSVCRLHLRSASMSRQIYLEIPVILYRFVQFMRKHPGYSLFKNLRNPLKISFLQSILFSIHVQEDWSYRSNKRTRNRLNPKVGQEGVLTLYARMRKVSKIMSWFVLNT